MNERRVIALGFFDGVHIGHGALLKKTCERAKALGAIPAAMSFDTHPDTLVFGTPTELLNTMDERKHLMQSLYGIEDVIFCHFDRDMMNMDWEAFVEDYLVASFTHVTCLWARLSFRRARLRKRRTGSRKSAARSALAATSLGK